MAIALIAVSPVHVLYAQEAREYSLWIVAILCSSAALLRAIRLKTNYSWAIYVATVTLGLYSHLLFVLVALGHGIYIVATESIRRSRTAIAYLLASLIGIFTFLPWLWILITYFIASHNRDRIMSSLENRIPLKSLLDEWFRNINRVFHDADLGSINIILVILAVYSIYFLCRHTRKRIWLFILTLIGVTVLTLGLPDLILGGRRSVRTRYLFPCYLGIELAVAYLLTTQITISLKWRQKFWQIVTLLLISGGVISGAISSQAETAWNKNRSATKYYPKIAQVINQTKSPLVISDGSETDILSLSHLLAPNVKLLLVRQNVANAPEEFTEVFFFDASDTLRERLRQEKNYILESIVDQSNAKLWKLKQL
jgi:uncharacterized membrane protein